jgi:putative ABC transport system permease protein
MSIASRVGDPGRARASDAGWRNLRQLFRIALRNLWRQRRRSGAALAAIGFGVIAFTLASGFIEWNLRFGRESTIHSQFGHIEAFRPGFLELGRADPFKYLLPDDPSRLSALRAHPHVVNVAPRLSLNGLASHGDTTISFIADGVEPSAEKELSRSMRIVAGEGLSSDDSNDVIVGQGLAANLGVKPGDTLVLLANTRSGSVNAIDVRVRGIFVTITKAYDDAALRMPIVVARRLLKTRGAHMWIVLLDDTSQTQPVLASFEREFGDWGMQWVPWYRLSDFYNKTAALFAKQVGVIEVIIAVIIALSISNTMMMTVMERVGEIGTAMALGSRRRQILASFLIEGLVLGLFGGCAGAALGAALAALISAVGVPMPPGPGMTWGFNAEVLIEPSTLLRAVALATTATLIASIYPSWKASRMPIVDALRQAK